MSSPTTTAEIADARLRNETVWQHSAQLLYAGDIDGFMDCWQPDGSYEAALPVPGLPAVITGTEALHAAFTGLTAAARSITVHDVVFHQTDDPDVAVIEERMVAELITGDRYENRFAIRATFRDGRIAAMVEYYGQFAHLDLLRKLGFSA